MGTYEAVMLAVLALHFLGVLSMAVLIGGLAFSLFAVIMTVHGVRCLWALIRKPALASPPAGHEKNAARGRVRHARSTRQ